MRLSLFDIILSLELIYNKILYLKCYKIMCIKYRENVKMTNMWMVRAGRYGSLFNDFKNLNIVTIGWELGDLSGKSPEEIKQIMRKQNSSENNQSIGMFSGQVSRFVHDFEIDDYIITYDSENRIYMVGKITSDYYYSDKLARLHDFSDGEYCQCRDVEWIGEVNRDDLKSKSIKHLNYSFFVFSVNESVKNDLLTKLNNDKIEWPEFYMEFADKLLEYKDNRKELINKIYQIFDDLDLSLPNLGGDVVYGNKTIPFDMDPFTVFGLFNKQISADRRIDFVKQIKKEFSIIADAPYTFHGISLVNNLKATFYWSSEGRNEKDVDNLWNLFEIALNFSKENVDNFISAYDEVINQKGILWNITMGLNWIRPFTFINLDANNRKTLSSDEIFSSEFKEEIKSLKSPPKADQYLHICKECMDAIDNSSKYNSFPELSHGAYISKKLFSDDDSDEGIGDGDVQTIKYWLISPGFNASLWDEFYQNDEVAIEFDGTGDLKQYSTKDDLNRKFQKMYNDKKYHMNNVNVCWQFVHDMQIGDVLFVKKGRNKIIGRGIVEGDYEYNTDKHYHKIRKVKWTHKGNWNSKDNLPMKALTDITNYHQFINNIKEFFVSDEDLDENPEVHYPEYNSNKFLEEVYIDEDDYNTLVDLVKNKKNLIVEGAPGVGKTFMAKRLAYSIMGVKDISRVMMVQFHQSYSYEDFVMGYRPFESGFKLIEGSFYNFCKKAEEDSENPYFFIIDEINRGNLSKIFGELFMLIENDKRGEKNKIQLLYSDELFFIPKNVYIIGLMNTADRSLAMMDYALRRRFAFFDLKPGFDSDGFINYQNELDNSKFDSLIEVMKELNLDINDDESLGEGFRIGHSYLCNIKSDDIEDKLNYIVEYELIPLLKEYWFDEPEKVSYWSDRLRSVLDD